MLETARLLGVDVAAMSDKCSDYSSMFIKQVASGTPDRQVLIDWVKKNFSAGEQLYMTIFWLNDKSEEIYTNFAEMQQSKDNATGL